MPKPEGWRPPEPPKGENPDDPKEVDFPGRIGVSPCSPGMNPSEKSEESDLSDLSDLSDSPPLTWIANVLSWVFVPLLMPVYGILLIFSLSIFSLAPMHTKVVYMLTVFAANFVVPMLLVLLLKKMGMVEDVGLNGRRERTVPYVITIFCLLGTAFFLHMKGAPMWVAMFYAGGALAALVNMIVNFRWKISAHAAGAAGIVAMLVQIMKEGVPSESMTWWIVGAILMAGALGSARIWLGKHTLLQVLAGTLVGFLSVWGLSLIR